MTPSATTNPGPGQGYRRSRSARPWQQPAESTIYLPLDFLAVAVLADALTSTSIPTWPAAELFEALTPTQTQPLGGLPRRLSTPRPSAIASSTRSASTD